MPAPIPPLSLVLGFGPTLLLLLLGILAWIAPAPWQGMAVLAGWLWGSAILLFLGGVARGLSFFTDGGPRPAQLVVSIGLFVLALGALVTRGPIPFALLAVGYAGIAAYDPRAAKRGWAPAHFARLRPPQMGIAVVGLLLLLARAQAG